MKKEKDNSIPSMKDFLFHFLGDFIRNFLDGLNETIQTRLKEISQDTKRIVTVMFLTGVGSIFFFIGIAKIIDNLIGVYGLGFLIVGGAIIIFALLLNLMSKK